MKQRLKKKTFYLIAIFIIFYYRGCCYMWLYLSILQLVAASYGGASAMNVHSSVACGLLPRGNCCLNLMSYLSA